MSRGCHYRSSAARSCRRREAPSLRMSLWCIQAAGVIHGLTKGAPSCPLILSVAALRVGWTVSGIRPRVRRQSPAVNGERPVLTQPPLGPPPLFLLPTSSRIDALFPPPPPPTPPPPSHECKLLRNDPLSPLHNDPPSFPRHGNVCLPCSPAIHFLLHSDRICPIQ